MGRSIGRTPPHPMDRSPEPQAQPEAPPVMVRVSPDVAEWLHWAEIEKVYDVLWAGMKADFDRMPRETRARWWATALELNGFASMTELLDELESEPEWAAELGIDRDWIARHRLSTPSSKDTA